MKRILIICMIGLITWSCSSTRVNYIGASFSSTKNVDIYFSEKDVQRDYMVMGQAEALQILDNPNIAQISQKELIKEAQKRGADGIIFKEVKTNTSTSGGWLFSATTDKTNIYATFIKYK